MRGAFPSSVESVAENFIAFLRADCATIKRFDYRVATMRSTDTVAMARKVAFTTSRP
jgi:hypothetical protein